MAASYWFKRFKKEVEEMYPHIRFRPLNSGFWRIYWKDHYIGEAFEEMPPKGYDIYDYDPRLSSQSYVEKYELHDEMVRKVKNFIEGYYDNIESVHRKMYLLFHSQEYFKRSQGAYSQMVIK